MTDLMGIYGLMLSQNGIRCPINWQLHYAHFGPSGCKTGHHWIHVRVLPRCCGSLLWLQQSRDIRRHLSHMRWWHWPPKSTTKTTSCHTVDIIVPTSGVQCFGQWHMRCRSWHIPNGVLLWYAQSNTDQQRDWNGILVPGRDYKRNGVWNMGNFIVDCIERYITHVAGCSYLIVYEHAGTSGSTGSRGWIENVCVFVFVCV